MSEIDVRRDVSMDKQEHQRVAMAIVAHADDIEYDGAGTVALWASEGWEVYLVVCTDGGGGGPGTATDVSLEARKKVIEVRKQEQQAASKILGVKMVLFLDYPDGTLQHTIELRQDLVCLFRRYKPTRIICQSPDRAWVPSLVIERFHPDHMAAGQATLAAVYPASQNPWDFPELLEAGLMPHKISEIYITTPPMPNYAIDITSTIEIKVAALKAHVSQIGEHSDESEYYVRTVDLEYGKKYQYDYAEEFHRIENY